MSQVAVHTTARATQSATRVNDSVSAFQLIGQYLGFEPFHSVPGNAITKNPLFIAIDVEFNNKNITQLGVSVLDTVSLKDPSLLGDSISNEHPISSILYSTNVSKYKERRRKPSHFGQRRVLHLDELRSLLESILIVTGPTNDGNNTVGGPRDIILVGHMINSDILEIKRSCGLDISTLTTVKSIMDTRRIAFDVLKPKSALSLKSLLITLGLAYVGLHNPAHDSRYTLRALLAMSCIAARRSSSSSTSALPSSCFFMSNQQHQQRLDLVERIAVFHQRRMPIRWCELSPRVGMGGNGDILDQGDDSDCADGILEGLF